MVESTCRPTVSGVMTMARYPATSTQASGVEASSTDPPSDPTHPSEEPVPTMTVDDHRRCMCDAFDEHQRFSNTYERLKRAGAAGEVLADYDQAARVIVHYANTDTPQGVKAARDTQRSYERAMGRLDAAHARILRLADALDTTPVPS